MKLLEHFGNAGKTVYDLTVASAPYSWLAGLAGAWIDVYVPHASVAEALPWILVFTVLDAVVGARVAARKGEFEFRKLMWKTIDKSLGYLVVAAASVWLSKQVFGKGVADTFLWIVATAVVAAEIRSALKHARSLGVARWVLQPIEDKLTAMIKGREKDAP